MSLGNVNPYERDANDWLRQSVDDQRSGQRSSFTCMGRKALKAHAKSHDIVAIDSLVNRKVAVGREAIEKFGAELRFLPAYSLDINSV